MGKFDKFVGPTTQTSSSPVAGSRSQAPATLDVDARHKRYLAKAQEAKEQGKQLRGPQRRQSFSIALDATGSMAPLIDDARQSIATILDRLYKEAGARVQIQIHVYRDYDVPNALCESSPVTEDSQELVRWLECVRAHGGGGNDGEAIEAVLDAVNNGEWPNAILLAGDEPSNSRTDLNARGLHDKRTAHDLARHFGQSTVPIHTFVTGADPRTIKDFAEIARLSGGCSGRLDGSTAMINMAVMAMLSALKGAGSVRSYMARHSLSENSREFGRLLLEGPGSK